MRIEYPFYYHCWARRGLGRYCKDQLSRARRRAVKAALKGRRARTGSLQKWESECNWKFRD